MPLPRIFSLGGKGLRGQTHSVANWERSVWDTQGSSLLMSSWTGPSSSTPSSLVHTTYFRGLWALAWL